MFNKSVEFVKKCVQVMVYWVNITSNDKRIFTYVHLRKAPCNEMQKATARGVHKSCLSKNDMVGTHSKPWRSSVKTPKQHKIAGKLNGMSFFLCVDPPISRTDPICTEPGPGSRTVPGSCGCRSFFLKTHVCCCAEVVSFEGAWSSHVHSGSFKMAIPHEEPVPSCPAQREDSTRA